VVGGPAGPRGLPGTARRYHGRMCTLTLVTPRLLLSPLTRTDALRVFGYRSQAEVSRYQFFDPTTLEDAQAFIDGAAESGWCQLGIRMDGGAVLAGDIGFRLQGDPPMQAELGVTLAPEHQGRGLATEAVVAVLDHLFGGDGALHRVFVSIDPCNAPSLAMFGRLGFRQEAYFRQSVWFKGEWVDDVVFGLLSTEWRIRRAEQGGALRSTHPGS
jgi:RimJ/RimL family protein N-acetyltransferase